MVGAEWRKAGRAYDALVEKVKAGTYVGEAEMATNIFAAWDALPSDFRVKVEARIFSKQYNAVKQAVNADLESKTKSYEKRIKDYQEAEDSYNKKIAETQKEQQYLDHMKVAIKYGEAMREFCRSIGVEPSLKWW